MEVMEGIRETAGQMHTGHWNISDNGGISTDEAAFAPFMDLIGVYRYFFSYVPEKARGRVPGTAHGDELRYVFGEFSPDAKLKITYTDADKRMAALVERYWTNFARSHDPNGFGAPPWPKDKRNDVLVLDWVGAYPAHNFRRRELDFVGREVPKL